ncbi:MAG: alpha/beta hydrolase [Elusimicrobia bacterium]|nr:alpha/beta hydrolase [Elusimicrobiota bacterium]
MQALALALALALAAHAEPPKETVVLLHGMGRTTAAMSVLAQRFRSAGYETLNFPYYQKSPTLDELSEKLRRYVADNVKTERYHFVCHSLGCIIIRNAFRKELRPGLGRIVMLAPPNRAARLAKLLKDNGLYRWLMGDSGQKLSDDEFYATLPVPPVEFAVIAGDKGQRKTFSEPNDGIVDVEGTKLAGMAGFAVVHHTHTFLMNAQDTFSLCRAFLATGKLP